MVQTLSRSHISSVLNQVKSCKQFLQFNLRFINVHMNTVMVKLACFLLNPYAYGQNGGPCYFIQHAGIYFLPGFAYLFLHYLPHPCCILGISSNVFLIRYHIFTPLNPPITLRYINIPIITPIYSGDNLPIGRVIERNVLPE